MYVVDKTAAPIRSIRDGQAQNSPVNINNSNRNSSRDDEEEREDEERRRMIERNEQIHAEQTARRKLVDSNSGSTRKRTTRPYSTVAASTSSSSASTSSNITQPGSKRIALHKDTNRIGYSVSPFSQQDQPPTTTASSSSSSRLPPLTPSHGDMTDYEVIEEMCDEILGVPRPASRSRSESEDSENDVSDPDVSNLPQPAVFRQQTMLDTTDDAFLMAYMERKIAENGHNQKDLIWAIERQKQTYESGRDVFVPVTDPFRKDLDSLREEGEAEEPAACFGCDYEEIEGHNTAYVENWNILLAAFLKGLANCTKVSSLARELHEVFKKTVVRRMNDDGVENASPEIWTPYCLICHFLFHNPSPDIDVWVTGLRLRMLKNGILDSEVNQEHVASGRRKTKLKGLTKLEKVAKLQLLWLKSNPATMAYACKNRTVDASSVSYLNPRMPASDQTIFSQPQSRFG